MPQSVSEWMLGTSGLFSHVDPHLSKHSAITSDAILIGARVQDASGKVGGANPTMNDFSAIGVVQSATLAQKKNLQQLYEIGSNQLYIVPGRVSLMASLQRVMLEGQSLIRALYGEDPSLDIEDAGFGSDTSSIIINLASEFLNRPFDLLFLFFSDSLVPLGGFYLEDAYVNSHQLALESRNLVVVENITLLASRIISLSV